MAVNTKALKEAGLFLVRNLVLVGVPTALTALTAVQPQYGVVLGVVLTCIDKYIHKLPNEYKGLLPF